MSFILAGTNIRAPQTIDESNSTLMAQQRTLDGKVHRDYFGLSKRIWTLTYKNVNITDYTTMQAIYANYLATDTTQTWQITETNYTVNSTNVHVDLLDRQFNIPGSSYLSEFSLILTEA